MPIDPGSVQPLFRRYWIKISPDGQAHPQFNPFTGDAHQCNDYNGPVAQILFYPMKPNLSQRIIAKGDKAEPSELLPLKFDNLPGKEVKFYRTGAVRLLRLHKCGFCGAVLDCEINECPACLAKDQLYCSSCDELKPDPIYDQEKNQFRCPDCEKRDPHGLKVVRCMNDITDALHFSWYHLDLTNPNGNFERHIILDYKLVKERLMGV